MTPAGPPPPPSDLTVTENGAGSLNISWSHEFVEGVPINFTLNSTSLNATSAKPNLTPGIQDQHYIFTVESSTPCEAYSFTVTAMAAGVASSGASEEVIGSIPSPPDISLIGNTLQHSLIRTAEGSFTLIVTFQV